MYERNNSIVFDNLNEYFVHAKAGDAGLYFAHFLCRYEKVLDGKAKAFSVRYTGSDAHTDDLKQIFSSVAWNKLKEYDAGDPIPFLQKIKYDTLHAWHDYIRTVCGATSVSNEKMYAVIRRAVRIYYSLSDTTEQERISAVRLQLKLKDDAAACILIRYTEKFRFSVGVDANDKDDDETEPGSGDTISEDRLCENTPSAEDDYFHMLRRQIIRKVAGTLNHNDLQILALTTGVCPFCFGNIPKSERKTYEQLALIQGVSGGDVIEKKRKKVMKKFREALEKEGV